MALATLANVLPRVISILGAKPGAWGATVSGDVGAFPSDTEINNAALEADEWVVTQGYFQSVNDALSSGFETTATGLMNGGNVPFHHGKAVKVEVSQDNTTWNANTAEAAHIDDIKNARANEALIGDGYFDHLYKIDGGDIWMTAPYARVTYPVYTRTSVLQANQNEESLVVFRTVAILAKNASPALFEYYNTKADEGLRMLIQDGAYVEQAE